MTSPASGTDSDPVAGLTELLDQLTGTPEAPAPAQERQASELVFRDVDQFVSGYLALVLERRVASGPTPGITWCPRWWAHPEALSRLYALWRAWEALRITDPHTGMSIWWRDHLDPHLAALTGNAGPFSRCGADRHREPEPLRVESAPAEVLAQLPDA